MKHTARFCSSCYRNEAGQKRHFNCLIHVLAQDLRVRRAKYRSNAATGTVRLLAREVARWPAGRSCWRRDLARDSPELPETSLCTLVYFIFTIPLSDEAFLPRPGGGMPKVMCMT